MAQVQYIQVDEDRVGQRIDNFLIGHFSRLPKALIYRWIRKGALRVNKKRIKPTCRVCAGDVIRIPPFYLEKETCSISVSRDHLDYLESLILFENDGYMIVNKPSGIAVHGGSGIHSGLIERLRQLRPQAKKLELVHRLDKETSGCIIIAKKYRALTYFHDLLKSGELCKIYHALVHGNWHHGKKEVALPLRRMVLAHGERVVRIDKLDGKSALTTVKPLRKFKDYTLVEARPKTGRTHQIRVHLASQNHPIVCDAKYGWEPHDEMLKALGFKRLFLHAAELRFIDPVTAEEKSFQAPYDHACRKLLARMSRH